MPRKNTKKDDPERQLMIKTKSCQRLEKEVSYYKKEVQENEDKLSNMKEKGSDPYDVKKFQEVLDESYMMIPDSRARFEKGLDELHSFMKSNEEILANDGDWISIARDFLNENNRELIGVDDECPKTIINDLEDGEDFWNDCRYAQLYQSKSTL